MYMEHLFIIFVIKKLIKPEGILKFMKKNQCLSLLLRYY